MKLFDFLLISTTPTTTCVFFATFSSCYNLSLVVGFFFLFKTVLYLFLFLARLSSIDYIFFYRIMVIGNIIIIQTYRLQLNVCLVQNVQCWLIPLWWKPIKIQQLCIEAIQMILYIIFPFFLFLFYLSLSLHLFNVNFLVFQALHTHTSVLLKVAKDTLAMVLLFFLCCWGI